MCTQWQLANAQICNMQAETLSGTSELLSFAILALVMTTYAVSHCSDASLHLWQAQAL